MTIQNKKVASKTAPVTEVAEPMPAINDKIEKTIDEMTSHKHPVALDAKPMPGIDIAAEIKGLKESLTELENENRVLREKSDPKSENSDITKLERKKERIPLEDRRHLTLVKDPDGYVGRWVSDKGARIPAFINAGYELVDRDGADTIDADNIFQHPKWRQSALSQDVGNDVVAYYMRIPEKWYKEAQAKKQAKIDHKENQMRSPLRAGIAEDKIYAADIKIEHGKG